MARVHFVECDPPPPDRAHGGSPVDLWDCGGDHPHLMIVRHGEFWSFTVEPDGITHFADDARAWSAKWGGQAPDDDPRLEPMPSGDVFVTVALDPDDYPGFSHVARWVAGRTEIVNRPSPGSAASRYLGLSA